MNGSLFAARSWSFTKILHTFQILSPMAITSIWRQLDIVLLDCIGPPPRLLKTTQNTICCLSVLRTPPTLYVFAYACIAYLPLNYLNESNTISVIYLIRTHTRGVRFLIHFHYAYLGRVTLICS